MQGIKAQIRELLNTSEVTNGNGNVRTFSGVNERGAEEEQDAASGDGIGSSNDEEWNEQEGEDKGEERGTDEEDEEEQDEQEQEESECPGRPWAPFGCRRPRRAASGEDDVGGGASLAMWPQFFSPWRERWMVEGNNGLGEGTCTLRRGRRADGG